VRESHHDLPMNRYVTCIDNKNRTVGIDVRKVYKVIDDPAIEAHGTIRIIDETGEDYMYEAGRFVPVELPEFVDELFDILPAEQPAPQR
jgi:hypothetical protein